MTRSALTIDSLAPGDLLLVISGFGMQRLHPLKELLAPRARRSEWRGARHERAPDGFLLAYGAAVQPARLPRGSIVDITPTVLYFLGLPIGRDMDGFARTDLFTRRIHRGAPDRVHRHAQSVRFLRCSTPDVELPTPKPYRSHRSA